MLHVIQCYTIIKGHKSRLSFLFFIILISSCQTKNISIPPAGSLFELMEPQKTAVTFENTLNPDDELNILEYDYYYNGGGVAAADFNNDGLTDLYFTGNQVSSKLYLNKGDFKFQEVTEKAGVNTKNWATGIAVADVNNDGLPDMYISYAGYKDAVRRKHQLFINKGIGSEGVPLFKDEAEKYNLDDTSYTTQSCFFDLDKDGDLDLLLINHFQDKTNLNFPKEKPTKNIFPGNAKLYRNDNGHFTDVSRAAGIVEDGYGLGVCISDINQDGWPDIYISKDFIFDDALYINNMDGTFTESIKKYIQHTSQFSMGCDIADFNNDSYPDILTVDMLPEDNQRQKLMNIAMDDNRFNYALSLGYMPQYSRNMLQINNGPDVKGQYSFSEIGQLAGIYKTDWSWSPLFADLNNDGLKDIFISNGIPRDITNNDFVSYRSSAIQASPNYDSLMTDLLAQIENLKPVAKDNFVFENNGDFRFFDQSMAWGMNKESFSNGAVYVDLDNDGDLDLVTNNINSVASIFKNNSNEISSNNYIRVKLNGSFAIGSKISITCNGKSQFIEHNPYRGFQSSQDPVEHFGLGKDSIVDTLKIVWLDGSQQEFVHVKANQLIVLDYKNAIAIHNSVKVKKVKPASIFRDITETTGIDFTHVENSFDDFDFEPLLPHKFSRNGPYIAIGDVDRNGHEDFWIGGPAKIPGKIFLQQSNGQFLLRSLPDSGFEDMGGIMFDANGDKNLDLYVVSGGNEYNSKTAAYQDRLYINDGKGNFKRDVDALPKEFSSGSCVVASDFDNDGDLDLFVGGRVVPGSYPLAPQSFIFQNDGKGKFHDVTMSVCSPLTDIGLVTSAIWSDFDKDGWTDLIVTGEWMPVTVFKNEHGKLKRLQNNPILDASPGWWFSIAAGDFDKDGDSDYIVGNLGLNNKYKASEKKPLTIYAKDFDGNGSIECILSYYLGDQEYTLANRDQITSVLPAIKKKFDTYTKFADADFSQIFSKEDLDGALIRKATKFASVYMENKGNGRFVLHDLPIEAQFSTIQSIQVKDFDGDGNLDALIAGNFFSPEFMTGRYDASIGLLLKGNGKGHFASVPAASSSISIIGDARATGMIRIENKTCLIAAVNSGKLQVYQINSY